MKTNNTRILHFMSDEKVISNTIQYFEEALPGLNKFLIVIPTTNYECQHVKIKSDSVIFTTYDSETFWTEVGNLSQYKYVIYHYLTKSAVDFTLRVNYDNFCWIIWGADLYNEVLSAYGYQLYPPANIIKKIKSGLQKVIYYKKKVLQKEDLDKKIQAIKKIKYLHMSASGFNNLKENIPDIGEHKLIQGFFYYPIDALIPKQMLDKQVQGNSIIVGNSASLTNNHIHVFEQLCNLNIGRRKVIVPLSYGANKKQVLKKGRKMLGANFYPLQDFLPLDDYNKLLLDSNTFIYGNYRAEAVGNILVALFAGGTVFLDVKNPLLKKYKEMGFVIYSIDELPSKIDYRLTSTERDINRKIIEDNYSYCRLINNIRTIWGG